MRPWHVGQRGRSIGSNDGSVEWANGMDAFPVLGGSVQHSQSPIAAEDGAVIGHPFTSVADLVVKIAHIGKVNQGNLGVCGRRNIWINPARTAIRDVTGFPAVTQPV